MQQMVFMVKALVLDIERGRLRLGDSSVYI